MKPRDQALLYLKKAAEDEALLDEILDSDRISDEIVGFHCQQAAEKIMKTLLSDKGVRFRKTHDLRELMDLLTDTGNPVPSHLANLDTLTPYGTLLRYDVLEGMSAHFDRREARAMISGLRIWVENQMKGSK